MNEYISRSEEETYELGLRIGEKAYPGQVIAFYGDLGAGKTVMVKGIAKGLGIEEMITSPTFTVLQEYESGRIPLYHLDVYRIEDPDAMEETGFFDFIDGDGLTVIEWAEQIEELLPENALRIRIERAIADDKDDASDNNRKITIEGLQTDMQNNIDDPETDKES